MAGKTLYDKIWDRHLVRTGNDGADLLYIDRQYIHEVTSPQAFEGLRLAGRKPRQPEANLAMADHNIPTRERLLGITDPVAALQVNTLEENCSEFGIEYLGMDDPRQGIVHIVGPEQGATQPGMTIVCGDSHTATHGALGALAFGIGTSEVEHVLATQCLVQRKSKNMLVKVDGQLQPGVTAKDIILAVIGKIGTAGGTGYTIEFTGSTVSALSVEERMTVCNMAIEAGARAGLIAADEKTVSYLRGRSFSPRGKFWEQARQYWLAFTSDQDAHWDSIVGLDAAALAPQVTWGTSPEMVVDVTGKVPEPASDDHGKALAYMGLESGIPITEIQLDKIFIGSCTNARISDLRAAAEIVSGQTVASTIKEALVVPGSGLVKQQAEAEGLDKIFTAAGFQWREPGCSMCLAMNADRLEAGERCASTSNRNFEGRQGPGGRTHLVSPAMAAAAALYGHFVDIREIVKGK